MLRVCVCRESKGVSGPGFWKDDVCQFTLCDFRVSAGFSVLVHLAVDPPEQRDEEEGEEEGEKEQSLVALPGGWISCFLST